MRYDGACSHGVARQGTACRTDRAADADSTCWCSSSSCSLRHGCCFSRAPQQPRRSTPRQTALRWRVSAEPVSDMSAERFRVTAQAVQREQVWAALVRAVDFLLEETESKLEE